MARVVNLAVTVNDDTSVALRVVPLDSEGNPIDADAKSMLRGRVAEVSDPAEAAFFTTLADALNSLISAKGW